MTPFLYILSSLILLLLGYWLLLRIFRGRSFWVYAPASIEKIQIQKLENIWSLYLLVSYQYFYKGEYYEGRGEIALAEFLNDSSFLLNDYNNFPKLVTRDISLISEEHIETYLMEMQPEIVISVFAWYPRFSKIPKNKKSGKDYLFQDVSIDFPWK